jgi:hypothetical protein
MREEELFFKACKHSKHIIYYFLIFVIFLINFQIFFGEILRKHFDI